MARINPHPDQKLYTEAIFGDYRNHHVSVIEDFGLTDDYPRDGDCHRQPGITAYDPCIDFESDQE